MPDARNMNGPPVVVRETRLRLLYLALGWLFFAIGAVGAVVPVLPTTPFMLVALWCFARSSERFHSWLWNHGIFGPPLRMWERHRVIPVYAKALSLTAMTASMIYVVGFTSTPWYLSLIMGAVILYGAWFIWTKPSRAPEPDAASADGTE